MSKNIERKNKELEDMIRLGMMIRSGQETMGTMILLSLILFFSVWMNPILVVTIVLIVNFVLFMFNMVRYTKWMKTHKLTRI